MCIYIYIYMYIYIYIYIYIDYLESAGSGCRDSAAGCATRGSG